MNRNCICSWIGISKPCSQRFRPATAAFCCFFSNDQLVSVKWQLWSNKFDIHKHLVYICYIWFCIRTYIHAYIHTYILCVLYIPYDLHILYPTLCTYCTYSTYWLARSSLALSLSFHTYMHIYIHVRICIYIYIY